MHRYRLTLNTAYIPIATQSSWKFCEIIESKALSWSWRENNFSIFRSVWWRQTSDHGIHRWRKVIATKIILVLDAMCICAADADAGCCYKLHLWIGKCIRRHVQIEQWHGIESDIAGKKSEKSNRKKNFRFSSQAVCTLCMWVACFDFSLLIIDCKFVYRLLKAQLCYSSIYFFSPSLFLSPSAAFSEIEDWTIEQRGAGMHCALFCNGK